MPILKMDDNIITPQKTIRGIASMIRSGGYEPEDKDWVANALDKAADEIQLQSTDATE